MNEYIDDEFEFSDDEFSKDEFFDDEFLDDEDDDDVDDDVDKALDKSIERLWAYAKAMAEAEGKKDSTEIVTTNMRKLNDLVYVYNTMKNVVTGENVKVTCGAHTPWVGSGYVRVRGKNLVITDPKAMAEAAAYALNSEILPYIDGTVEIDFGFHDLVVKLKKES